MILREEGLEAVWARHRRLAGAVWAAFSGVIVWGLQRYWQRRHNRAAVAETTPGPVDGPVEEKTGPAQGKSQ